MDDAADLVIVGGGPVGAVLALALERAGLAPVIISPAAADGAERALRPVALAHGSRLIFERLDAWAQLVPATPIERIHVSQRAGFGRAELTAEQVGLPALGYVVDYGRLHGALAALLAQRPRLRVIRGSATRVEPGHDRAWVEYSSSGAAGRIEARLVVVADGGTLQDDAAARTVDYGQSAVVAIVGAGKPQPGVAFERFTATGPLALLPYGERYALIWSVSHGRAPELCGMPGAAFAGELEREFGGRLGAFHAPAQRAAFALVLRVGAGSVAPRIVRIGNAAQTLHPVAGQGLNLGLRDAWELATALKGAAPHDIGSSAACAAYRSRRRLDRSAAIGFTDLLVRGYSNEYAPLRAARGIALTALGCVPPARDFLVRRMAFGPRV